MELKFILKLLHNLALQEDIDPPFIVGGLPRDKIINNSNTAFNDIDLANGSGSITNLAKELAIKLRQYTPLTTKQSIDGHVSIFLPNLKLDFSSNFNVPGIDAILKSKGINNPTNMQREIYSRDFTINTLLMSLDFKKIKDMTGQAIPDIKNKIIRTCLTPDLAFKFNVNRIIRVVYLAAKLGFRVDPEIIKWVINNPNYILKCDRSYLSKNINKALQLNSKTTIDLITKMNLWNYIPITAELYPYFAKYSIENNI